MTAGDIERIERELELTLPSDYKEAMLKYPLPPGSTDHAVWDDAEAIISYAQEYREGFADSAVPPWPKHFLLIGDDGAASTYVLDLSRNPAPVLLLDHGNPGCVLEESPHFSQWLQDYLEELGEDNEELAKPVSPPSLRRVLFLCLAIGLSALILGYLIQRFFIIV